MNSKYFAHDDDGSGPKKGSYTYIYVYTTARDSSYFNSKPKDFAYLNEVYTLSDTYIK